MWKELGSGFWRAGEVFHGVRKPRGLTSLGEDERGVHTFLFFGAKAFWPRPRVAVGQSRVAVEGEADGTGASGPHGVDNV